MSKLEQQAPQATTAVARDESVTIRVAGMTPQQREELFVAMLQFVAPEDRAEVLRDILAVSARARAHRASLH